jgi:hypothetical protein
MPKRIFTKRKARNHPGADNQMKFPRQKKAYARIVKALALSISIFALLSACNENEKISDPIPVDTGNYVVKQRLVDRLRDNDIPFAVIDETAIEVSRHDVQVALLELNRIENAILPTKRSTAIPQPGRATFIHLLERHDVAYKELEYAGQVWIVWEEADHEKALGLLERAIAIHRP